MSMSRVLFSALVTSTFLALPAFAEPLPLDAGSYADRAPAPIRLAAARGNMGGGFFEFLFNGGDVGSRHPPAHRGRRPHASHDAVTPPSMDSRIPPQTRAPARP